jgi:hypothetical protein
MAKGRCEMWSRADVMWSSANVIKGWRGQEYDVVKAELYDEEDFSAL